MGCYLSCCWGDSCTTKVRVEWDMVREIRKADVVCAGRRCVAFALSMYHRIAATSMRLFMRLNA